MDHEKAPPGGTDAYLRSEADRLRGCDLHDAARVYEALLGLRAKVRAAVASASAVRDDGSAMKALEEACRGA